MTLNGGATANFGFTAQRKDGVDSGHFNYVNQSTGLHLNGAVTAITEINQVTRTITFTGTDSKTGCTFTVRVTDNGEPGTNDRFSLQTTCGETVTERPLTKGNLQWHSQ